jgi:hypothetical protein
MTMRGDRAIRGGLGALAALQLLLFFHYLKATTIFGLYYDMSDYVLDYARFRADGDLLQYLWFQHAEHRLAITRLVLLADVHFFDGIYYPFVVVSLLCVGLAAAVLVRAVYLAKAPRPAAHLAALLVVMLIFDPAVATVCSAPIQDIYPHTVGFAALALCLFGADNSAAPSRLLRRILALLAAAGAGFGSAAGLLVWPLLLWIAWRERLGLRWTIATFVCGAAFIAVYVHGLALTQNDVALSEAGYFYSWVHLRKIIEYFLIYMGLPWSHDPRLSLLGEVLGGLLLLVCLAVALWRGAIARAWGLPDRVVVGLLLFAVGTAALASLGRVDIGEGGMIDVPIRYTIFLSVAHAALVVALLPVVAHHWQVPARRRAMQAAALGLGLVLVVMQVGMGEAAIARADWVNAGIARFMAGDPPDPDMRLVVSLAEGKAPAALAFIRSAQIYEFRR